MNGEMQGYRHCRPAFLETTGMNASTASGSASRMQTAPPHRYRGSACNVHSLPMQARGNVLNPAQRRLVHDAFRAHPALHGLSEDVLEAFCENGRLSSHANGEVIYVEDAPCHDIQVILSGAVEMSLTGLNGEHVVSSIMLPGEVINVASVVDGARSMHDQRAHGFTRLFHVPMQVLYAQFERDGRLLLAILELICARSRSMHRRFGKTALLGFRERLVDQLLNLAERCGEPDNADGREGVVLGIGISQESLAALLGVSRQRVNKELGWLGEQGIVQSHYRRLKILDLEALRGLR